jgi:hypothetical protein
MTWRTKRFGWGLIAATATAAALGCGSSKSATSGTGGAGGGTCTGWVVNEAEGTALDQGTGLTWQLGQAPQPLDWQDAQTYCKGLSLDGGGWSLPTEAQLSTLLLNEADPTSECFLLGCVFGQSSCQLYWSSTELTGSNGNPSFVNFEVGYGDMYAPSTPSSVKCVR